MVNLGKILNPLWSTEDLRDVFVRKNLQENMLKRIIGPPLIDEEIWTCIFCMGFINAKEELYKILTGGKSQTGSNKTWLEMLPLPPRKGHLGESEGNSNIDLVVGAVGKRAGTKSGLQYDPNSGEGICFVEAKWLSDLSCKTSHDPHRNQLARVIESAITLQHHTAVKKGEKYDPVDGKQFPSDVHVTLLTPAAFKKNGRNSRFYSYKFLEYENDREMILDDIKRCTIAPRQNTKNWVYPDIEERLKKLTLHWVTYEDLFMAMPEGKDKEKVRSFVLEYGRNTVGRDGFRVKKNEILDMSIFDK